MEKEIFCDGMVKGGGDCDADCLNFIEKVSVMEEGLGPISFGDFLGTGRVDVHHTDQFHPFHFGIFFCMELAKVTDTDHTHPDLIHLTTDPPLRMLDEMEEMLDLWHLRDLILSHPLHRLLQCQTGAENDAIGFLQGPQGLLPKSGARLRPTVLSPKSLARLPDASI